jgi:polar amino acid transport system permease protein
MIDFGPVLHYWVFLARAVGVTLELTLLSVLVAALIGVTVAMGRAYGGRLLDAVLALYVDTMRAVPLLVVLVWVYFAFPLLAGMALPPLAAAVIGLGVHLGAYVAETVRAGLLSVRPGQMRAALALGMSRGQAVRKVVLPQALIRMLPPLGSLLTFAIKDSAIASVIAVPEIIRQSQVLNGITYRPFEVYTIALLIYFLLCWLTARGVDRLYRRLAPLGAS